MSINTDLLSFFSICSLFFSFLITLLYLKYNWKTGVSEKLITVFFTNLSMGLLVATIAIEGWFKYFPHLSRTGFFFALSVAPIIYLSLTKGLQEKKFSYRDLAHGLIPLIYLINFIPYFLSSTELKLENINQGDWGKFNEGWLLPKYWVNYIAFFQNLVYLVVVAYRYLLYSPPVIKKNKTKYTLSIILSSYLFLNFIPSILSSQSQFDGTNRGLSNLIFILLHLVYFLLIISQPKILYSKKQSEIKNLVKPILKEDMTPILPPLKMNEGLSEKDLILNSSIMNYLEDSKAFKKFDFSQEELGKELGISEYQIRNHLKKAFNLSFSDFINYKRIEFLVKLYEQEHQIRNYQMAILAKEIGFKSVNSLYLNFKKIFNKTPREIFDQIEMIEKKF